MPDNQLDAVTDELVAKLLLGAPKAMAATKQLLQQVQRMDEGAAFAWTAKLSGELFASDEASEGMSAFAAKRPATWTL